MKYVLVTGAASGLGKHLTLKYAELGYTVYALDIDKNNLVNLPKENIIPLCMNIASEESWDRDVLPRLEADNKGLDIVIACAAVMHIGSAEDCSVEDWNRVNGINLTGQYLTAKKNDEVFKTK